MRSFDPSNEEMSVLRQWRIEGASWNELALLADCSAPTVKRHLVEYNKELMNEKAFRNSQLPPPLTKDCRDCRNPGSPDDEVCSWPCSRAVSYKGQVNWMPMDLRGRIYSRSRT